MTDGGSRWNAYILNIAQPTLTTISNIFVVDGELWKKARHATSTIFTTIIEPCASRSMEGLTDKLRSATGEEHSIDVCNLFFWFTFNSVAQMTFGKDLDLLGAKYSTETDSPASSRLAHRMEVDRKLEQFNGKTHETLNPYNG
ncbi:hypothetical protein KEM48_009214 [Puccinia striiformis f. sp. tritici PST-130]|uniref:Uncharacterized protein n=1 Tax=Puccinia striiformis f. sp. tritici PST-78 TaxID=1165861 RepID=A0A0L0V9Y2_9BASI|nr:hypothetical protein KEM48_009214 [Puccinia striiformis f. sp. tritici PST-130]KNE95996.1 hypothetical protein PSTG_10687 [Puccinia striiformis f. sp. tritici PST-78]